MYLLYNRIKKDSTISNKNKIKWITLIWNIMFLITFCGSFIMTIVNRKQSIHRV